MIISFIKQLQMQLQKFLLINGVLFIPFGISMFIIPNLLFPIFGINLDSDGTLMAKVSGSAVLSLGLICYLVRHELPSSRSMKAILWGNFIFHLLDTISTGLTSFKTDMNSLGWIFTTLHLLLSLGFLYFIFIHKSSR